ncbi:MAG: sodium:solute symporter [Bryobacterales bacterium]|nr:sodium:solute symporter [Bryobacterales bacterium]
MRYFDLGIIALYLVGITWFGAQFRSSQKSLKDYFLGGKNTPWWAISLSIVSAETSTLTIIGTPALAFGGNLSFLQLVMGYLLARLIIIGLFLPQYYRGELYTAYELMRNRFGERVRKVTASIFLVTRALAEGVRVYAISIVVAIILGAGETPSIIIILLLTLFYTFEGGMTAVIWTDVVQMFLYVAGAILSFYVILNHIDGGWAHVWTTAAAAGKLQVFDFQFAFSSAFFSQPYTFLAGFLGGTFLTTATHGTEQLMVQRLLAAKNEKESRIALLSSWGVIFFQFVLFLFIGIALYVYYQDNGMALPALTERDKIYPRFIWEYLPVGVAGIVMAAILAAAMSNISAALNSLASTTVMDFYRPLTRAKQIDSEQGHQSSLKLARWTTVIWGGVLLAIALLARQWGNVLEAGLTVASVSVGALLGVFLLGILTKRVGENGTVVGVIVGLSAVLYLKFGTNVAWTWYVIAGSLSTLLAGVLVSPLVDRSPKGNA